MQFTSVSFFDFFEFCFYFTLSMVCDDGDDKPKKKKR